jgi:putative endonuclease
VSPATERTAIRRVRGAKAHRDGRGAETLAALWLMAKGWRILGVRLKTPQGEIDLLARRGGVLAVVEVKRRATLDQALEAVAPETLAARRPDWHRLAVRLDLIAIGPRALPRHLTDAWPSDGGRL